MDTGDLLTRTYAQLGLGGNVFWPEAEVIANGLNPAQRLLVLLKPALLTQRTAVSVAVDQVFLDLRALAPTAMRMQRVCLGDITGDDPVLSQGREGDLRKTSLTALRAQKDWFRVRRSLSSHWYTHGLHYIGLYPRATQAQTVTLAYSALPTALTLAAPTQVPDLPQQWHSLIAEAAACILQCKEGAGEVEQAVQRLSAIIGAEPFKALHKAVVAEKYREQARAARGAA